MARIAFPALPTGWLTRDKYDSLARIGSVERPLLIVHGEQDALVPVIQGEELFRAANQPKRLQLLSQTGHNAVWETGGETYWGALKSFAAELEGGAS